MSGCLNVLMADNAAGTPWVPTDLGSALKAWYKADAGVYKDAGSTLAANGETVQQWNDQSGTGNNLFQATAARPTFLTGTLNSLPVLSFVAATPTWITGIVNLGGTTASAFMVAKFTIADSNGRILSYSNGSGVDTSATTCIFAFEPTSLTTVDAYNNGIKSSGTISASSWNQIGSIFDGANHTLYLSNVGQTPVAASPTLQASGTLGIATSGGGGDALTMQIAEIIVTNTAAGSTDRNSINSYLTGRWGV